MGWLAGSLPATAPTLTSACLRETDLRETDRRDTTTCKQHTQQRERAGPLYLRSTYTWQESTRWTEAGTGAARLATGQPATEREDGRSIARQCEAYVCSTSLSTSWPTRMKALPLVHSAHKTAHTPVVGKRKTVVLPSQGMGSLHDGDGGGHAWANTTVRGQDTWRECAANSKTIGWIGDCFTCKAVHFQVLLHGLQFLYSRRDQTIAHFRSHLADRKPTSQHPACSWLLLFCFSQRKFRGSVRQNSREWVRAFGGLSFGGAAAHQNHCCHLQSTIDRAMAENKTPEFEPPQVREVIACLYRLRIVFLES